MKKLVLFDLDGTLINSIDDLADSTNYALQQCGLPLHTVDEYKYFVGNSVDPLIRRALPEEEKENQELFDRVKKIYLSYYAAHSKDKTRPYPGISDLLSRCNKAGVLVAVVSNKPDDITADVVRYYFPQIHFAATMGPKEGIPKKPDPLFLFLPCPDAPKNRRSRLPAVPDDPGLPKASPPLLSAAGETAFLTCR